MTHQERVLNKSDRQLTSSTNRRNLLGSGSLTKLFCDHEANNTMPPHRFRDRENAHFWALARTTLPRRVCAFARGDRSEAGIGRISPTIFGVKLSFVGDLEL